MKKPSLKEKLTKPRSGSPAAPSGVALRVYWAAAGAAVAAPSRLASSRRELSVILSLTGWGVSNVSDEGVRDTDKKTDDMEVNVLLVTDQMPPLMCLIS